MVERTGFTFGDGDEPASNGVDGGAGNPFGATTLGSGDGGTSGGDSGDDFTFDGNRHISRDRINADGTFRRKRARRGSGGRVNTGQKKTVNTASVDGLAQALMIVHAGLASVTKIKEFKLDKDEGNALANAVANVLVEFDIPVDDKTAAIVGLVVVGASTYGPRMYLYNERMKEEKRAKKAPATIHTIDGVVFDPVNGLQS